MGLRLEGEDFAVSVLGCICAGLAFVPLSRADPPARIMAMADDASIGTVIGAHDLSSAAEGDGEDRLKDDDLEILAAIERCRAACEALSRQHRELSGVPITAHREASHGWFDELMREQDQGSVAYVCFTSGTTGRPKGVEVAFASLRSYAAAKNAICGITRDSTVLLASHPTFDPCLGDIVATALAGATLAVPSQEALWGAETGAACLAGATHALLTPALLRAAEPGAKKRNPSHEQRSLIFIKIKSKIKIIVTTITTRDK